MSLAGNILILIEEEMYKAIRWERQVVGLLEAVSSHSEKEDAAASSHLLKMKLLDLI